MFPALEQDLTRFRELEQQLADPAVISDSALYGRIAREHGNLAKRVRPYLEFRRLHDEIATAEALIANETDPEMKVYAQSELNGLREKYEQLKNRLEEQLLLDPSEQYSSVIVEIRAGTGGMEAALFAGDLFDMYSRYAKEQGWDIEVIEAAPGEMGGFKEITFSVTGETAYEQLRYESGGHRVQRVPKTETQGRIHTSAATVAVLPEPDEVQVQINEADIEWERMRAGGAGGQHVNKTESAVRLWYRRGTPDEIEVKCQDQRSQHKNYERALRVLKSRVYERQREQLHKQRAEQRRSLIGSGDRSERIRTYNFPQNRVTDHRIGLTMHTLDSLMMGEMAELMKALRDFDRQQRLQEARA